MRAKRSTLSAVATRIAVLIVLTVTLAFGASPAGAQDDDPGELGVGLEVYNSQGCAGCHGADGTGSPAGRPLTDIAIEQPDRAVHLTSVIDGKGQMPAYGDRITEEEASAVVSYLRLTFVSEEAPIDELPNTGLSAWLFVVGLGLIAFGGAAVVAVEPAKRFSLANR